MKHFVHIFLLLSMCFCFQVQAQGLKTFKLKNGMSVFIWEDSGKSDVFGEVVVRTGAVNDPEQYTGLAHYLEHVMFKGTQKIGALDWEKEAPIYEQIIAKYDEMAGENDPVRKKLSERKLITLLLKQVRSAFLMSFPNSLKEWAEQGLMPEQV